MKKHTALILFFVVLTAGIILARNIGVSWDEPDYIHAGGAYWNFFRYGFNQKILESKSVSASYFGDRIYTQIPDLATTMQTFPPISIYVGTLFALGAEWLGFGRDAQTIISAFHLATAVFFALLVATVYRFARLFKLSPMESLFAALVTFLYPTLFGYGYSNIKDTAQVAMFVLALYYLVKGNLWTGAVAWGLSLATKFNAIYAPIIWTIGSQWQIFNAKWSIKKWTVSAGHVVLVIIIGLLVAFIVWPYLWIDPIHRAIEVVRYYTSVGGGFALFWNGNLYRVGRGQSLWWYPLGNLLVTTPIPLLILGMIGLVEALRKRARYGLLPLWFLVPLLRTLSPAATFYDGLRHFVEILPAFALLSAVGLGKLKKYALLASVFVIVHLLIINVAYFPYSTGYYNALVKDANTNFDRDIEGLSIKEAMDYLHAHDQNFRVWAPIAGHLAWYWMRAGDTYVYDATSADVIVLMNKSSHISRFTFESKVGSAFVLDHTIGRGRAIFAWIYRRK